MVENAEDPKNPHIKYWKIEQNGKSGGGPYSHSSSNLEDNGIVNIVIPIDELYGEQLIKGSLNSSGISLKERSTAPSPQTGKEIQIPAKKVIRFKPGSTLGKTI